jgi:cysteine sulfinate desulfinase/cysteine desulfurase-like protein
MGAMKVRTLLVAVALPVLIAVALVACGGSGDGEAASETITVELSEQSGSGQSGTATLAAAGEVSTTVVVELSNAPEDPQPAHIHAGTCEQLDPTPAYALANVENGRSRTTLPVALDELRNAELVINVHESVAEIATYSACGAI